MKHHITPKNVFHKKWVLNKHPMKLIHPYALGSYTFFYIYLKLLKTFLKVEQIRVIWGGGVKNNSKWCTNFIKTYSSKKKSSEFLSEKF